MIASPYQPMPQMPPMGMGAPSAAPTRIIKRPITDVERQFAQKAYKMLQNVVRGISLAPLVIFVFSYVLSMSIDMGPVLPIILGIFIIVFSLVGIGMSINLLSTRKKMAQVMQSGMAIEVQGPAFRNRMNRNMPMITVGPISMMETPETRMIPDGAPVSVLCIPQMKAVLSINNVPLQRGTRATFPPNLEMMAEASYSGGMPMQPPAQQPMQPAMVSAQPAAPQYYPPAMPQQQPQQPASMYGQYAPQMAKCPSCGAAVQSQWTSCAFCGAKLMQTK